MMFALRTLGRYRLGDWEFEVDKTCADVLCVNVRVHGDIVSVNYLMDNVAAEQWEDGFASVMRKSFHISRRKIERLRKEIVDQGFILVTILIPDFIHFGFLEHVEISTFLANAEWYLAKGFYEEQISQREEA
jgi:hypothetical protein